MSFTLVRLLGFFDVEEMQHAAIGLVCVREIDQNHSLNLMIETTRGREK